MQGDEEGFLSAKLQQMMAISKLMNKRDVFCDSAYEELLQI